MQPHDSRTTGVCQILGVIRSLNLSLMTKLTRILTLNDTRDAAAFEKLLKFFCLRLELESGKLERQPTCQLLACYWCLYNIDVVQRIVYIILTAADGRSASI